MPGSTTVKVEVVKLSEGGLWPDLDIDLEVESIRHPELYPLVSRR